MKLNKSFRICQLALYRYRYRHELCNFIRTYFKPNEINDNFQYFVYHEDIHIVIKSLVNLVIQSNKIVHLLTHIENYLLWLMKDEVNNNLMNRKQYNKLIEGFALF